VELRGVRARIEWEYVLAATIDGYTLGRSETGIWHLEARLTSTNPIALKCVPLVFVAAVSWQGQPRPGWRWPILTFEITQHMLRARLGPPEQGSS